MPTEALVSPALQELQAVLAETVVEVYMAVVASILATLRQLVRLEHQLELVVVVHLPLQVQQPNLVGSVLLVSVLSGSSHDPLCKN